MKDRKGENEAKKREKENRYMKGKKKGIKWQEKYGGKNELIWNKKKTREKNVKEFKTKELENKG